MLNKLICRIVGHYPWVYGGASIREADGRMEVYVAQWYGACKRCDARVPEDYGEKLAYRFHPARLREVKLTQTIETFDEE